MMDLDAQFHARTHYMQYEYVRKTSQEKKGYFHVRPLQSENFLESSF